MGLSPVDIAILGVKSGGWSATPPALDLTTAVAVALITSAGDPGKSGGLWGLGNGDPAAQAKHAHEVQAAQGWDAFKNHKNGAYLLAMPTASAAVAAAPIKAVIDDPSIVTNAADQVVGSIADAAGQLGDDMLSQAKSAIAVLYKAGAWLGNADNWARILLVLLGSGMVIGGVTLAAGGTAAGPVLGFATKAVKGVGTVAKAATKAGGK